MATIPRPRTPLDETLWRDSAFYRHYAPLPATMVMHYFYASPFFDSTSNNGQLLAQLQHNPAAAARIQSQQDFDDKMRAMRAGVEYVIAAGSAETGVWVIRKQMRRSPELADVVADYYIVGENIYQAPSVGAVLGNRVLSITRDLRHLLRFATDFYTSTPTSTPTPTAPEPSQPSAASTPLPSSQKPPPSAATTTQTQKDTALLRRALALSLRHNGEYMDDHAPLLGDPGSLLATAGTGTGTAIGGTPGSSQGGLKK